MSGGFNPSSCDRNSRFTVGSTMSALELSLVIVPSKNHIHVIIFGDVGCFVQVAIGVVLSLGGCLLWGGDGLLIEY